MNILKSLLNKRNPVPFHPCSTVTNKIYNRTLRSSGTGTGTDSSSLDTQHIKETTCGFARGP